MSTTKLNHVQHVHFVGIGGAGMGGIAEVLFHQGYKITGSDLSQNPMVQHLKTLGITVFPEHKAENITGADVLVTSTIIATDNPEIITARAKRIPIMPRAQMLADLMRGKRGIAIAGTHGKTTTTSLMTSILTEAGLDPTYVIGGQLKKSGVNAHLGSSPLFVAEADESDASFLFLHPEIAIVTNIDADHLGTYDNDFNRLQKTFVQFLHKLPFNGLAVMCLDDPVVRQIIPEVARPMLTYGFHEDADIRIIEYVPNGFQTHFTLQNKASGEQIHIRLNLPGAHNALNAAATYTVAYSLGVAEKFIQQALEQFSGVGRRMQIYGELNAQKGKILLIDDYGHHPREITATWSAIRQAWPDRRLVVAYQPHRYSRTRDLFEEFVQVLSEETDQLILLDIYSAGETPIPNVNGESLCSAIRQRGRLNPIFVPKIDELSQVLCEVLQDQDILLTQGAGSIGTVAPKLLAQGICKMDIT